MSKSPAMPAGHDRLLTFEIGGGIYALPISGILEVAEVQGLHCIPTVPAAVGGVVNYHGDALPVVRAAKLLELDGPEEPTLDPLLVITDRAGVVARLGLPVDRVIGFVDDPAPSARARGPVAERRSIQGRVTRVLDPDRLVARARAVIEESMGDHPTPGG